MIFPFGSLIFLFACQYISRTMLVLLNSLSVLFNNIILRNLTPIYLHKDNFISGPSCPEMSIQTLGVFFFMQITPYKASEATVV